MTDNRHKGPELSEQHEQRVTHGDHDSGFSPVRRQAPPGTHTDFVFPSEDEDEQSDHVEKREFGCEEMKKMLRSSFEWVIYGDGSSFELDASMKRLICMAYLLKLQGYDKGSLASIGAREFGRTKAIRATMGKHMRSLNHRFGVIASGQRKRMHKPSSSPRRARSVQRGMGGEHVERQAELHGIN